MKPQNPEYWYFTRRERRAALLLLITAISLWLLPLAYPHLPLERSNKYTQEHRQELIAFHTIAEPQDREVSYFYFDPNTIDRTDMQRLGLPQKTINTITNYREKGGRFRTAEDLGRIYTLASADYQRLMPYIRIGTKPAKPKARKPKSIEVTTFPFDPNTATPQELLSLGFPKKVADNLLRYREKGGRLRQAEDLRKIYGMPDKLYQRLLPLVRIEEIRPAENAATKHDGDTPTGPRSYEKPHIPVQIDINKATVEEWQLLWGIGPTLSARIVKFREKLGGFYRIEQIAETYGLPDSTFQRIRSRLKGSPLLRHIDINTVSEAALQDHPYISRKQARVIIAYRREHGPFLSIADLQDVRVLPAETLERLEPYLRFHASTTVAE